MRRLLLALALLRAVHATAAGESVTRTWIPVRATSASATGYGSSGQFRCTKWVATRGITNATQIAWELQTGMGGGGSCGVGIYDVFGSTRIATTGAVDCSAAGSIVASGLSPFTLTSGTIYQVCGCGSTNAGTYLSSDAGIGATNLRQLTNAFAALEITSAANPCSGGAPPLTTGALSANATDPQLVIVGTGTP